MLSLAGIAAVTVLRLPLEHWLHGRAPYELYFLPILLAAWYGGVGPIGILRRALMKKKIAIAAAVVVVVALIGALAFPSAHANGAVSDLGESFVEKLRKKDVRGAYEMLSPRRRAKMTFEEFRPHAEHVAFATNDGYQFSKSYVLGANPLRPTSACVRSRLVVGGKEWAYQTFFVRGQGDDWYVESFAMQEPADMHLEELLEECRSDSLRTAGYHGPPIVNRLPRLE